MDRRMDMMITRPTLAGVGAGAVAAAERYRRDAQVRRRTWWLVRSTLALATVVLVLPRVAELHATAEQLTRLSTVPMALLAMMAFTLALAMRLGDAIAEGDAPRRPLVVEQVPAPVPTTGPAAAVLHPEAAPSAPSAA